MELEQALDQVFSGEAAPQEQPKPDAPQEAPQEVQQPQEPVEQPQPEAAPQPEPKQEDHTVPLAKFLDQRDELKELRRFKQEQEAKAATPPRKMPDPLDDPEGFGAHQNQVLEQRLTAQKFEMSDVIAKQAHGAEKVEAAAEWALERAQKDPVFAAQYMREPHPIDWIVRQHQRDGLVSSLPSDVSSLDELIEREIAKRGLTAAPAAPAAVTPQSAPKPAAPRPSLVNAPSGGGVTQVPLGTNAALEAVFPR